MNKECIQCGLPFRLYDNGYLFVQSNRKAPAFETYNGSWLMIKYQSLLELELLLDEAQGFFFEEQFEAGISPSAEPPYMTVSLNMLAARVMERETVEIINNGTLISYLQPIVSLKQGGRLYGYESLLRTEGTRQVSPGKLFGTAHETGLLSLLDKRAREAAIKAKKEKVPAGIKSFINFLPSTIYNPAYCLKHTFNLVEKYRINPDDLVFEVVESEKINDIDHLKKVLNTYKEQGMKVALDDVGTGFSTLQVLEKLNPDYVKIDRKYIQFCDQNASNQEFLARVIEIAKRLEITVLAEGIERMEEAEYCREIGIDLAQGYYFGKPGLNANYMSPSFAGSIEGN
jgi:EAL domain-containing protein (putative c-di-GMP-specific phosphodiesterase class I)